MAQVRKSTLHGPFALSQHNQLAIVPADERGKVASRPWRGRRFGRIAFGAKNTPHQVDSVGVFYFIRKEAAHRVSVIRRYDKSPALAESIDELPELRRRNLLFNLRCDDIWAIVLGSVEVDERLIGPLVP